MKKMVVLGPMVIVALFLVGTALAHFGPDFYVPQVPPGTTITIDGDKSDWAWMDPAYIIPRDMIHEYHTGVEDPAVDDLDIYAMLAWTPPPDNMIYVFCEVKDDMYSATATDGPNYPSDDSLELGIDASHNGGDFRNPAEINGKDAYQVGITGSAALPYPVSNNHTEEQKWILQPPWLEAYVTPIEQGATDVTYVYEVKFALWDWVDYGGPDAAATIRHINEADQTIGMYLRWMDVDATPGTRDHAIMTSEVGAMDAWTNADFFNNFILVPAETAVEASSWGAIKASFD